VERLQEIDPDQFRPAIAECMAAWYFAVARRRRINPRPNGRGTRVLEMAIRSRPLDIGVEVKSPEMPELRLVDGAVQSEREFFRKVLKKANDQFANTCPNVLVVAPRRKSMFTTLEWRLRQAFIGDYVISWDVDPETQRIGTTRPAFDPSGHLVRGPDPMFTRVSAVMCLEDYPDTRHPSFATLGLIHGVRDEAELQAAHDRFFSNDNRVYIRHSVVVIHNPNAPHRIAPTLFGNARQLIVEPEGLRWIGQEPF
jgi:hypothetical protein